MRPTISILILFLFTTTLHAQFDHIPPCGGSHHSSPICYGYAMGRAFGKEWNSVPCDLSTLNFGSVSTSVFYLVRSTGLQPGTILAFEETAQGSNVFGHVAYVNDSLYLDQVDHEGGEEIRGLLLEEVVNGNLSKGVTAHGSPAAKYTKKKNWQATLKNDLSPDFGTIRIVLPGEGESHPTSPYSLINRFWGETVTIDAEMNGQEISGLTQIFQNWSGGPVANPSSQATSLYVSWSSTAMPVVKATFLGKFIVSGTKIIQSGVTVTISSGTPIEIAANSELVVYGRLIVNGTSAARILFASPTGTTWKGIRFEGSGANNSSLNYCNINNALAPIVANNVGNLTINNVTIGTSSFYSSPGYAAMAFYNSSPTISYVTVNGQSNSGNGARFAQGSTGSITTSTIQNLGAGNGIVVEGNSTPTISGNTIQGNHYHGIVVGYNSTFPQITGNAIHDNGLIGGVKTYNGILFDNGHGAVMSNTIYGNNFGVGAKNYSFPRSYYTIPDAGNNDLVAH